MAGRISPAAQQRINLIGEFLDRVYRVHGLVEQYAAAKQNADAFEMPIRRAFDQLKMGFTGAGLDALSQLAGSMTMAMRRGGSQVTRTRIMREGVGSMRFQLELEQRAVANEDMARQQKEAAAEEE